MAEHAGLQRRIDRLLAEYGESHENETNKLIHWLAVPAIAWSVLAILWSLPLPSAFIPIPFLDWATLAAALAILYYYALSPPLAFGMAGFCLVSFWLMDLYPRNEILPLWGFALGLFLLAWCFQFIGHKIEGKKPSFLKDVQFLLIGPAWLMHFLFRRLGIPF